MYFMPKAFKSFFFPQIKWSKGFKKTFKKSLFIQAQAFVWVNSLINTFLQREFVNKTMLKLKLSMLIFIIIPAVCEPALVFRIFLQALPDDVQQVRRGGGGGALLHARLQEVLQWPHV